MILILGKINPCYKGSHSLEAREYQKNLGVVVKSNLNLRRHCASVESLRVRSSGSGHPGQMRHVLCGLIGLNPDYKNIQIPGLMLTVLLEYFDLELLTIFQSFS